MQDLEFVFRTEEIKKLLDAGSEFIVIKTQLESAVLQDGSKACVLQVKAKAVNRGRKGQERSIGLKSIEVNGCPKPPCTTDDDEDNQP
jgi:hypothetical protein